MKITEINTNKDTEIIGIIAFHKPFKQYGDCVSIDGFNGSVENGKEKLCKDCDNKLDCKNTRYIYLHNIKGLHSLAITRDMDLVTFSRYIMRLLSKGLRSNNVVTKIVIKNGSFRFTRESIVDWDGEEQQKSFDELCKDLKRHLAFEAVFGKKS